MNHLLKTELLAVSAQNKLTYSILVSRQLCNIATRILTHSDVNNVSGVIADWRLLRNLHE